MEYFEFKMTDLLSRRESTRIMHVQVFVVSGNIEIQEKNQAKDKEGYTVWIFGTIPR